MKPSLPVIGAACAIVATGLFGQPALALDPPVPVTITPKEGPADGTVHVSIPSCSAGTVVKFLVFGDRERTPADPVYPWQLYNSGPARTYRRVGLGDPMLGAPNAFAGLPTPIEVDVNLSAADEYRNYTPSPGEALNLWIGCFTPNTDGTTYGMRTTGSFTISTPPTPTPDADLTVGSVAKLPARQKFGKAKYSSATPKVCKVVGGRKVKAVGPGSCVIKARPAKKGTKRATVRIRYEVAAS